MLHIWGSFTDAIITVFLHATTYFIVLPVGLP